MSRRGVTLVSLSECDVHRILYGAMPRFVRTIPQFRHIVTVSQVSGYGINLDEPYEWKPER